MRERTHVVCRRRPMRMGGALTACVLALAVLAGCGSSRAGGSGHQRGQLERALVAAGLGSGASAQDPHAASEGHGAAGRNVESAASASPAPGKLVRELLAAACRRGGLRRSQCQRLDGPVSALASSRTAAHAGGRSKPICLLLPGAAGCPRSARSRSRSACSQPLQLLGAATHCEARRKPQGG